MKKSISNAIDKVIDCAMNVIAENGPDPDYRRFAQEELAKARKKLIDLITKEIK